MSYETELFESERAFLAAGSRAMPLGGATLLHMPDFADIPEATAVQNVDTSALLPDPLAWLVSVESAMTELEIGRSRIRLDAPPPQLEISLSLLGYQPSREIALLRPASPLGTDATLIRLREEADWARMVELHQQVEATDGVDAERRVDFERAKHDAGATALWLAVRDGAPCATVATSQVGGLLRIHHVAVASMPRSRGAAAAVIAAVVRLAHIRGLEAVALFSRTDCLIDQACRGKGFTPIGSHVTWERDLAPAAIERSAGGLSPFAMERLARKQGYLPWLSASRY